MEFLILLFLNKGNNSSAGGEGEPAYVKHFNYLRIDLGDYIWFRGEHWGNTLLLQFIAQQ